MSATASAPSRSAFELVEEAFHLVRRMGLNDLATYYIGTLPFVAGLLYFWVDMTHHSVPESRAVLEALGVTLLFIWMKVWQVSYARRLWRLVATERPASGGMPGPVRLAALIGRQTMIHASGLLALPLALMFVVPFGAAYAFYQNATVLEDMTGDGASLRRRALKMATAWPRQNHMLIWSLSPVLLVAAFVVYLVVVPIVSAVAPEWSALFLAVYSTFYLLAVLPLTPFAVITGVNIATVLILLPHLIKMLTGVQLLFLTGSSAILNSFFMAVVCALTWCALDPLVKAAYVLRCFYIESRLTGEDLRSQLPRASNVIPAALILLVLLSGAAGAAEPAAAPAPVFQPAVAPADLDKAIDAVLASAEYDWRLPREPVKGGVIGRFLMQVGKTLERWAEALGKWLDKFGEWLDRHFRAGEGDEGNGLGIAVTLLYIVVAVLVVVLAVGLFLYIRRNRRARLHLATHPLAARPDLEDEATTADALPEEAWLRLADEMLEQGNLRLALRAAFLATLTTLSRFGLIQIARFKSNYDYRCELDRRVHAAPAVLQFFTDSARIYDSVWYGEHETTSDLLHAVLQYRESIQHAAAT